MILRLCLIHLCKLVPSVVLEPVDLLRNYNTTVTPSVILLWDVES